MAEYKKPVPYPSPETERYWQGCKQGELWLPYCLTCDAAYWYPRPFCPRCFSHDVEWRRASGRGTLYSFAIQYRPQGPGFEPPYVTAIVQLEEGPRMLTNLVDVEPDPEHVRCDMPLEVVFEDISDEIALPKFRPASAS
jgi:uncharacterized OB-fold protein